MSLLPRDVLSNELDIFPPAVACDHLLDPLTSTVVAGPIHEDDLGMRAKVGDSRYGCFDVSALVPARNNHRACWRRRRNRLGSVGPGPRDHVADHAESADQRQVRDDTVDHRRKKRHRLRQ